MNTDPANIQRRNAATIRSQCIQHATDLLTSAEVVFAAQKHNIAYHLALLALEELGKLAIVEHADTRTARERGLDSLVTRHGKDHVSKIFWALWRHSFGRQVIDAPQIDGHRAVARDLHEQRLAALYVNPDAADDAPPAMAVAPEFARSTIDLVSALIAYEQAVGPVDPDFTSDDLEWFLQTASVEPNFRLIFGRKAQQKLIELGDMSTWISWLRKIFEAEEAEIRALIDRERTRIVTGDGTIPKWRLAFTLHSATHSIRPKALQAWNEWSNLIKLRPAGKRNSATEVELTIYENIAIDDVAPKMLSFAKATAISLNIGAFGIFWWYVPERHHPLYARAHDLESNRPIDLDYYASFRAISDQRDRRALVESDMLRIALVFGHLPKFSQDVLLWYWSGLALLCKSDPLLELNAAAMHHFWRAFRHTMRSFGMCHSDHEFEDAARAWLPIAFDGDTLVEMQALFARGRDEHNGASFHDALNMKIILDFFICHTLQTRAHVEARESRFARDQMPAEG